MLSMVLVARKMMLRVTVPPSSVTLRVISFEITMSAPVVPRVRTPMTRKPLTVESPVSPPIVVMISAGVTSLAVIKELEVILLRAKMASQKASSPAVSPVIESKLRTSTVLARPRPKTVSSLLLVICPTPK
jgi:hypothetical protein